MIYLIRKNRVILYFTVFILLSLPIKSFTMSKAISPKTIVKLTYTGPQNKVIPSVIFKEPSFSNPIEKFKQLDLYFPRDEFVNKIFSIKHKKIGRIENIIIEKIIKDNKKEKKEESILTIVLVYVETDEYKKISLSKTEAINIVSKIKDIISYKEDINKEFNIWINRTDLKNSS